MALVSFLIVLAWVTTNATEHQEVADVEQPRRLSNGLHFIARGKRRQVRAKPQKRRQLSLGVQCTEEGPPCATGLECACNGGRRLFGAPAAAAPSPTCTCEAAPSPPPPPHLPPPPPPSLPPPPPIYNVGGSSPAVGYADTVYKYDGTTWSALATKLPSGMASAGATILGSHMYLRDSDNSDKFWRFLLDGGSSWEALADFPFSGYAQNLVAIGTKIYVVGGRALRGQSGFSSHAEGDFLKRLYEYDTSANTWTRKADMATARFYGCAAPINGLIYAVGGQCGDGCYTTSAESYDPSTDTWTFRASSTHARLLSGCGSLNGELWYAGGSVGGYTSVTDHVETYVPASDTWTTRTSLPIPSKNTQIGISGSDLYALSGNDGSVHNQNMWRWDAVGASWVAVADQPSDAVDGRVTVKNTDE